jgi:Ca2+-binding RTX toxin-like protein
VADFAKVSTSLIATKVKNITVEAGAAELILTGTGAAGTGTINAGSSTGPITWGTIAATGNLTFTGSAGVDTLTIGTTVGSEVQTYNLGDGDDVVTLVDQNGQAIVNGEDGDDTFTVSISGSNIDGLALHGGNGIDKLSISATSNNTVKFDKGFSGIEKIVLNPSNAPFTAEFHVDSGYDEAVEINDLSGQNVTLEFKTDAGGTIDLSNFIFLGGWNTNDTIKLTGDTGNETLIGTSQADSIDGGAGNDTIIGGAGADIMTGGAGADVFLFANGDTGTPTATNFDTITDFGTGDIIDLGPTAISALSSGSYGNINVGSNGLVTTSYTTLAAFITDLGTAGISTLGAAMIAAIGGHGYLFISDGVAGLGSGDLLIKVTGVPPSTGLTIVNGDIVGIS